MSRVGLAPVNIVDGVQVLVSGLDVKVSGKRGDISKCFNGSIKVQVKDDAVYVSCLGEDKKSRSMWGTARAIINNMVKGVSEGFVEELEIVGVGYRVAIKDKYINLALGKSHNTKILIPEDVVASAKGSKLSLSSIDKEALGQFVAKVISQRPPEPYKGKGIKKVGQYIQRKETKKG